MFAKYNLQAGQRPAQPFPANQTLPQRILVVEDEVQLAKGLRLNFELEGYAVDWAATGAEADASQGEVVRRQPGWK